MSSSFTASAADIALTQPSATPPAVTPQASLTIAYDAAAGTYTLSSGARGTVFSVAQRDPTMPNQLFRYANIAGPRRQYLTLVGQMPGDAKALDDVGAGLWEDYVNGETRQLDLMPFVYGNATADANVPRTGKAQYDVRLLGQYTRGTGDSYFADGTGKLNVDFFNAAYVGSGNSTLYGSDNQPLSSFYDLHWDASGVLDSQSNGLDGPLSFANYFDFKQVLGTVSGQLYGAAGLELGAVVTATGDNGDSFAGALVGRQNGTAEFDSLSVVLNGEERAFSERDAYLGLKQDSHSGFFSGTTDFAIETELKAATPYRILYFGANGDIDYVSVRNIPSVTMLSLRASDIATAETTALQTVYRSDQDGVQYQFTLGNPGAGNPLIELTYSNFARLELTKADQYLSQWMVYGLDLTPVPALGRSGTGDYRGVLLGDGVNYVDGSRYALSGSAAVTVDFDTNGVSGTFTPVTSLVSGATMITLPELTFAATLNEGGRFTTSFSGLSASSVSGTLYGPKSEELGGPFSIDQTNGSGTLTSRFVGAYLTKVQDSAPAGP